MLIHNGDNTTQSVIDVRGETIAEIIHATIADNQFSDTAFGKTAFQISSYTVDDNERRPELRILSSIIDHFGIPVLRHTMANFEVEIGCIIANEINSISSSTNLINTAENQPGGSYLNQVNPGFKDRGNRDYHLDSQSQAIDYCKRNDFSGTTFSIFKDIDYQNWGVNDPNNSDLSIDSFWDIGADESYAHDIIFTDGFE